MSNWKKGFLQYKTNEYGKWKIDRRVALELIERILNKQRNKVVKRFVEELTHDELDMFKKLPSRKQSEYLNKWF